MSYKLKLDIFEGPLDLLLYLIKKDDLDNNAVKQIRTLVDKVSILEEKLVPVREDATALMTNLFGPKAGELIEKEYAKEKRPEVLLKHFKEILSKFVGPENAEKQMQELYEKYSKGRLK